MIDTLIILLLCFAAVCVGSVAVAIFSFAWAMFRTEVLRR